MRRRVPKKRRTIKNPEKLIQKREVRLKNKINEKPTSDNQEIPSSVRHVMKYSKLSYEQLSNLMDQHYLKVKRRKQQALLQQINYEKNNGESEEDYLSRISFTADSLVEDECIERKYKVDIKKNESGGFSVKPKEIQKDQNLSASKKKPRIKKKKRLKLKKQLEREEKKEEIIRDNIRFGEVVYEPPKLNTEKLKIKESKDKKLKNSGKKFLARQRILSEERERAVALYQNLKNKKFSRYCFFYFTFIFGY